MVWCGDINSRSFQEHECQVLVISCNTTVFLVWYSRFFLFVIGHFSITDNCISPLGLYQNCTVIFSALKRWNRHCKSQFLYIYTSMLLLAASRLPTYLIEVFLRQYTYAGRCQSCIVASSIRSSLTIIK